VAGCRKKSVVNSKTLIILVITIFFAESAMDIKYFVLFQSRTPLNQCIVVALKGTCWLLLAADNAELSFILFEPFLPSRQESYSDYIAWLITSPLVALLTAVITRSVPKRYFCCRPSGLSTLR
jgi:hypothetical protein